MLSCFLCTSSNGYATHSCLIPVIHRCEDFLGGVMGSRPHLEAPSNARVTWALLVDEIGRVVAVCEIQEIKTSKVLRLFFCFCLGGNQENSEN